MQGAILEDREGRYSVRHVLRENFIYYKRFKLPLLLLDQELKSTHHVLLLHTYMILWPALPSLCKSKMNSCDFLPRRVLTLLENSCFLLSWLKKLSSVWKHSLAPSCGKNSLLEKKEGLIQWIWRSDRPKLSLTSSSPWQWFVLTTYATFRPAFHFPPTPRV